MMALAVAGIAAFPLLPVAPLPGHRAASGSKPGNDGRNRGQPLERQFAQISSLTDMTSTSTLGSTSIVLQFDLDRNVDAAAQDVQAAISAANRQLPTNLPRPRFIER
jgi:hydrophobic/amphiphilic exporter-1 (mainly G- bacteria), HAE1 family